MRLIPFRIVSAGFFETGCFAGLPLAHGRIEESGKAQLMCTVKSGSAGKKA
jgi:hypothetical protein